MSFSVGRVLAEHETDVADGGGDGVGGDGDMERGRGRGSGRVATLAAVLQHPGADATLYQEPQKRHPANCRGSG